MSIIEKLFRKRSPLKLEEVRMEEKRLELKENQILCKVQTLDKTREKLFKEGADTRSKSLRRIYARKFEDVLKQVQMEERDLVRIGKELRFIGRIKLVLEHQKTPTTKGLLQRLNESQMQELMTMIDADNIKEKEFIEKIDIMLGLTEEKEVEPLGKEGLEVMNVWEKMDEGEFEFEDGLKEATRAVTKEAPEERPKEKEREKESL